MMPAASILNHIKPVHPHSHKVFFFQRRKEITRTLYSAVRAYRCSQVLPCFVKPCLSFSVSSSQKFQRSISVCAISLSCRTPLFVLFKENVYALYLSLLCAHLLHFLSISPHCLLSLSFLPINYSAQSLSLQLRQWARLPPEVREWQESRKKSWLDFCTKKRNCRRQSRVKKSGELQGEDIEFLILWPALVVATTISISYARSA